MKKYLISPEGKFYKANLHCHTTISDGKMTPEEVKEYYKAHGYSVVAYTDHCIMLPHHDLDDEEFIALSGYENEQLINQKEPPRRKDCHVCYISLKKDNDTMPYYLPRSIWGNGKIYKDQVKFNFDHTLETWGYGAEYTNRNIALAREQGFFVTYNHPQWSAEHYTDYTQYTGMNAMEIFNYGCWVGGYDDYNPHVYDEFLRKGERIYAIATDDNKGVDVVCAHILICLLTALGCCKLATACRLKYSASLLNNIANRFSGKLLYIIEYQTIVAALYAHDA